MSDRRPLNASPNALRDGLPPLPDKMKALPVDARGYPVPWFVAWIDGVPDFRVIGDGKLTDAFKYDKCWICGDKLGIFKTFAIGPMCAITRTTSEPPSHWDCAHFAVRACPFMVLPDAKRNDKKLPVGWVDPPGKHLKRNPGVTALWRTTKYRLFEAGAGRQLIEVGPPENVSWFARGRDATRQEVVDSIAGGMPSLSQEAAEEGAAAVAALKRMVDKSIELLPQS